jgi:hypothetical protein
MGVSTEQSDRPKRSIKHMTKSTTLITPNRKNIMEYCRVKHMLGVVTLILHNCIPFLIRPSF